MTNAQLVHPLYNSKRRFPPCNIIVYPALVQGQDAPFEISRGLKYLDDREDNQVIYYEITNKDTGSSVLVGFNRTNITGTISIKLSNLDVGNYTIRAYYPETSYYTEISNETVFRVIGPELTDLNVTKIWDDNDSSYPVTVDLSNPFKS